MRATATIQRDYNVADREKAIACSSQVIEEILAEVFL